MVLSRCYYKSSDIPPLFRFPKKVNCLGVNCTLYGLIANTQNKKYRRIGVVYPDRLSSALFILTSYLMLVIRTISCHDSLYIMPWSKLMEFLTYGLIRVCFSSKFYLTNHSQ